jgi:hypothetical protein
MEVEEFKVGWVRWEKAEAWGWWPLRRVLRSRSDGYGNSGIVFFAFLHFKYTILGWKRQAAPVLGAPLP